MGGVNSDNIEFYLRDSKLYVRGHGDRGRGDRLVTIAAGDWYRVEYYFSPEGEWVRINGEHHACCMSPAWLPCLLRALS